MSDDSSIEYSVLGQRRRAHHSTAICSHRNSACTSCNGCGGTRSVQSLYTYTRVILDQKIRTAVKFSRLSNKSDPLSIILVQKNKQFSIQLITLSQNVIEKQKTSYIKRTAVITCTNMQRYWRDKCKKTAVYTQVNVEWHLKLQKSQKVDINHQHIA